jgi:hypothetical protein
VAEVEAGGCVGVVGFELDYCVRTVRSVLVGLVRI